jgi:hypothetical protein
MFIARNIPNQDAFNFLTENWCPSWFWFIESGFKYKNQVEKKIKWLKGKLVLSEENGI